MLEGMELQIRHINWGFLKLTFRLYLPLFCFLYIAWYGLKVFKRHETSDDELSKLNVE